MGSASARASSKRGVAMVAPSLPRDYAALARTAAPELRAMAWARVLNTVNFVSAKSFLVAMNSNWACIKIANLLNIEDWIAST